MALPTSDNTVNVTRLASTLSTLWNKIKNKFATKTDLADMVTTVRSPSSATNTNYPSEKAVASLVPVGSRYDTYVANEQNITPIKLYTVSGITLDADTKTATMELDVYQRPSNALLFDEHPYHVTIHWSRKGPTSGANAGKAADVSVIGDTISGTWTAVVTNSAEPTGSADVTTLSVYFTPTTYRTFYVNLKSCARRGSQAAIEGNIAIPKTREDIPTPHDPPDNLIIIGETRVYRPAMTVDATNVGSERVPVYVSNGTVKESTQVLPYYDAQFTRGNTANTEDSWVKLASNTSSMTQNYGYWVSGAWDVIAIMPDRICHGSLSLKVAFSQSSFTIQDFHWKNDVPALNFVNFCITVTGGSYQSAPGVIELWVQVTNNQHGVLIREIGGTGPRINKSWWPWTYYSPADADKGPKPVENIVNPDTQNASENLRVINPRYSISTSSIYKEFNLPGGTISYVKITSAGSWQYQFLVSFMEGATLASHSEYIVALSNGGTGGVQVSSFYSNRLVSTSNIKSWYKQGSSVYIKFDRSSNSYAATLKIGTTLIDGNEGTPSISVVAELPNDATAIAVDNNQTIQLSSSDDLNTLDEYSQTTNHFFWSSNNKPANSPVTGSEAANLYAYYQDLNNHKYSMQVVYCANHGIFQRRKDNNVWTAWSKMLTALDLTLDNSAPLEIGTSSSNLVATGKAHYHNGIGSIDRTSVTTPDIEHINTDNKAHMVLSQITSASGNTHDPGDGYVLTFMWDTETPWDSQLYIPDAIAAATEYGRLKFRSRGRTSPTTVEWGDWQYLPSASTGTLLTSSDNINNIKGNKKGDIVGYYWVSTSMPTGTLPFTESSGWGAELVVYNTADNYCIQVCYRASKGIYQRLLINNQWGDWSKMMVSGDITSDTTNELSVMGIGSSGTTAPKYDTNVTVQGGNVKATTYKFGTNASVTYNSTTESIDFSFA